jgi:hypothetical protein
MLSLSRNLGLITGASVTGTRITFAAAAILIVGALAIAQSRIKENDHGKSRSIVDSGLP